MDTISSTITEEFLTCPICFEVYKDPKVLPCLHSFCKTCIDNFISERNTKTIHPCPVCRENFKLENLSTDELKTNFCLKNLIEIITSGKEDATKLCTFCSLQGESIEASSQCLTCKDLLCSECADFRHRSTTLTINHKVVLLTEIISGKYNDEIRSKQQIPCSEHTDEDLRYFCETCDTPICRDCIVLGHQSHKFIAPSDARKEMDKSINLLMNALKENLEQFRLAKENVSHALDSMLVEKQRFIENLEKRVNDIINNIKESKLSIENDLEEFLKSKQDSLRTQGESIEKDSKQLEETYSFCNNILKCGNDMEILTMKTEMNERLSKLKSFKSEESCSVKEIELPTLEINTDGKAFRLVFHNRKESEGTLNTKSLNPGQKINDSSDKKVDVLKNNTNDRMQRKGRYFHSILYRCFMDGQRQNCSCRPSKPKAENNEYTNKTFSIYCFAWLHDGLCFSGWSRMQNSGRQVGSNEHSFRDGTRIFICFYSYNLPSSFVTFKLDFC